MKQVRLFDETHDELKELKEKKRLATISDVIDLLLIKYKGARK